MNDRPQFLAEQKLRIAVYSNLSGVHPKSGREIAKLPGGTIVKFVKEHLLGIIVRNRKGQEMLIPATAVEPYTPPEN